MRIAYLDMIGGASGDMLISALLDAGLSLDDLNSELALLPVGGFRLSQSKVKRAGIEATLLAVDLDDEGKRIRHWPEFESAIQDSRLPEVDKDSALKIFDLLADAESAAHGVSKEETHLHELGTVDTLIDVVGVIVGFRLLGVDKVYASPFPLSSGTSRSSHGVMAATAAATAAIYRQTEVPVKAGGLFGPRGEAVTPTGAATLASIADFSPVSFTPMATGYGAGNRDPEEYPNVVGLWLDDGPARGSENSAAGFDLEEGLWALEANIDDMTPEALAHAQGRLLNAGALDVWLTPTLMKKGRPATVLSVLVKDDIQRFVELMLRETSTLGVRRRSVDRYVADREFLTVDTVHGQVRVKIKKIYGSVAGIHPEHDDCQALSAKQDVPLREVVEAATAQARTDLGL